MTFSLVRFFFVQKKEMNKIKLKERTTSRRKKEINQNFHTTK